MHIAGLEIICGKRCEMHVAKCFQDSLEVFFSLFFSFPLSGGVAGNSQSEASWYLQDGTLPIGNNNCLHRNAIVPSWIWDSFVVDYNSRNKARKSHISVTCEMGRGMTGELLFEFSTKRCNIGSRSSNDEVS